MLKANISTTIAVLIMLTGAAEADDAEMAKKGGQAYRICAACHSLLPGVNLSGPSLADRWGKRAATVGDYGRYTEVLKTADIIWDENTLNAWLVDRQAMLPGTAMTFRGVEQNDTRANLIAFLRQAMAPGGTARVVREGLLTKRMAEGQIPPELSSLGANQRIKEIRHCRDAYYVTTLDGAAFPFWEANVRLKTDSSPRGPKSGEPVLLRSGMVGDRVSVVFSSLAEISRLVAEKC